jgi:hypothetical protein
MYFRKQELIDTQIESLFIWEGRKPACFGMQRAITENFRRYSNIALESIFGRTLGG